jgi:dihydroflavonol-4-reductase
MVFVTGGTGLVGANLIISLVEKGEEVMALIRPETSITKFEQIGGFYATNITHISNKVKWVEGDLLDMEGLLNILPTEAKVYHCAAMVSFNPKDANKLIETNVEGTANLVNACLIKQAKKLCHVSSIGALGGKLDGQIVDEETPWSGIGKSAYSLSKYNSELEVWRGIAEGLPAVIVNPAVILGAGIWDQGSPHFFQMASKGQRFYTLGSTSYVDVRDVSRAMILLMESEIVAERFILASQTLTYKELFVSLAKALNAKAPSFYANKYITGLVWRVLWLKSLITGKAAKFTKNTHSNSHLKDGFSGEEIENKLGYHYTPILDSIRFVAEKYVNNIGKN